MLPFVDGIRSPQFIVSGLGSYSINDIKNYGFDILNNNRKFLGFDNRAMDSICGLNHAQRVHIL